MTMCSFRLHSHPVRRVSVFWFESPALRARGHLARIARSSRARVVAGGVRCPYSGRGMEVWVFAERVCPLVRVSSARSSEDEFVNRCVAMCLRGEYGVVVVWLRGGRDTHELDGASVFRCGLRVEAEWRWMHMSRIDFFAYHVSSRHERSDRIHICEVLSGEINFRVCGIV